MTFQAFRLWHSKPMGLSPEAPTLRGRVLLDQRTFFLNWLSVSGWLSSTWEAVKRTSYLTPILIRRMLWRDILNGQLLIKPTCKFKISSNHMHKNEAMFCNVCAHQESKNNVNIISCTHWGKNQLFIHKFPWFWCMKMWILSKMRLWKCEFCQKMIFSKCEFLDKLWIFAPVWSLLWSKF